MATLRNHNAHRDIGFMTDRGKQGIGQPILAFPKDNPS
mgnify:FL=1